MSTQILFSIVLALSALLTGCGGSESSSAGNSTANPLAVSEEIKIAQAAGTGTVPGNWKGRAQQMTPNMTWAPKNMVVNNQDVMYVLGQGNPAAVSLKQSEYVATEQQPGESYVRPETEVALIKFLSSLALKELMLACSSQGVSSPFSYPIDFGIEKWLYVDQDTKRKQINNLSEFGDWIIGLRPPEIGINESPIAKCFSDDYSKARLVLISVRADLTAVGKEYFNQVK